MKNILARGGIEFISVLLGISGSLWIDKFKAYDFNNDQFVYKNNTINCLDCKIND